MFKKDAIECIFVRRKVQSSQANMVNNGQNASAEKPF